MNTARRAPHATPAIPHGRPTRHAPPTGAAVVVVAPHL
jgi:hypothetical protein